MKSAYEQGIEWESCREALEMREAIGPDKTQADWWRVCPRGDWLIWQLERLPEEDQEKIRPALLRAVSVIAERTVRKHCLNCGEPYVEKWAQKYLSGNTEARTAGAAGRATGAAWSAGAVDAAAEGAAWAARAAAGVAEGAAWTAWAADAADAAAWAEGAAWVAELEQQANDIREQIPEWPGDER